jgi:uncharacterized membrane protein YtjA (UPF0391 family)
MLVDRAERKPLACSVEKKFGNNSAARRQWNEHSLPAFVAQVYDEEIKMGNLINWAIIFLIVALVAGLFGFGGLAGTAMGGAKMLFWVAIILFLVSAIAGFMRRRI